MVAGESAYELIVLDIFKLLGHSYVAGGAGSFNGGDLISDAKNGVVTVTIQYRLGIFGMYYTVPSYPQHVLTAMSGFLSGSQVKANGALNAGLRESSIVATCS